eukprot:413027-Lingulodinium_polyedra.AAC.1
MASLAAPAFAKQSASSLPSMARKMAASRPARRARETCALTLCNTRGSPSSPVQNSRSRRWNQTRLQ